MASLSPECTPLKDAYYNCFNKWYADELLKGSFGGSKKAAVSNECQQLFETYKECVWKAIKEKKIDTLINEARKDDQSK
ncbi:mitochondrial distribution and morphology protein Mdm35 [Rhizoclosmatium globosum]|uniref:Mitochondrial distribution and morphology protein Mdm35 n=1 Tax=Rhizoclosmatium globosum TaxID=329046 RepID=A0A1Y2CYD9_9FUNG|nr:mitochondrial distribution and morphology protein Mdm35 [Rhizoclosmatium globosum]|eukprot:ORY52062.1 mitochondrial distribution and morphology protein Mdm35 [Rhizoclosmatium globosum]